jgi:hypothetical protein
MSNNIDITTNLFRQEIYTQPFTIEEEAAAISEENPTSSSSEEDSSDNYTLVVKITDYNALLESIDQYKLSYEQVHRQLSAAEDKIKTLEAQLKQLTGQEESFT